MARCRQCATLFGYEYHPSIPLSASLTAERRELLFPTTEPRRRSNASQPWQTKARFSGEILVEQGDQNLSVFWS